MTKVEREGGGKADTHAVAERSRPSRRDLLVLGGLVGVGALTSIWLRATAPLARDVSSNSAVRGALATTSSRFDGNPAGDVRVVAFNDFLCPICKITAPELENAVRADGRVRVEYVDLTLFGPVSEEAARLGLALTLQGRYPQFHHAMMDARRQINRPMMRDVVQEIGGDWARADSDIAARKREFTATLNKDALLAFTLGISGTPAFLIDGLLTIGRLNATQFGDLFGQARDLTAKMRTGFGDEK